MSSTPGLSLPYVTAGTPAEQAHNSGLNTLDVLVRGSAISRAYSSPPSSAEGDVYIINGTPSGDWAASEDKFIAARMGGQWTFIEPKAGVRLRITDEDMTIVVFDGTTWRSAGGDGLMAASRVSTNQTLSGSFAGVQWNQHDKFVAPSNDKVFSHDTSTNPDQITIHETGNYMVQADVSVKSTGTAGAKIAELQLSKNGSSITYTMASAGVDSANMSEQQVTILAVVSMTAGDILRVEARNRTGTGTMVVQAYYSRLIVRRV